MEANGRGWRLRKRGVRCDGTHRNRGDNVMVDIKLIQGDCLEVLKTLEAGSVDAVVTDPPYNVGFGYSTYLAARHQEPTT